MSRSKLTAKVELANFVKAHLLKMRCLVLSFYTLLTTSNGLSYYVLMNLKDFLSMTVSFNNSDDVMSLRH